MNNPRVNLELVQTIKFEREFLWQIRKEQNFLIQEKRIFDECLSKFKRLFFRKFLIRFGIGPKS